MSTYIVNKREYREVDRLPASGDRVVSKINFYDKKVMAGDILEVDYVTIEQEDDTLVIGFQNENGLWAFTSYDQFSTIEPTNKPISHEQEILLLEDELDKAYRYINNLEERIDVQDASIEKLFDLVKPLQNLKKLLYT